MNPTLDFLQEANKIIRLTLDRVRPKLLEAQGNIGHTVKNDASVVTEMDTFVEDELKSALLGLDKGIGFGGEEGGVDYDQRSFWLVDPIDGTEPFIRGIPIATNMIALIDNNEPVLGIIYNFFLGDYYLAIKGHGATCNGHTIHVSDRPADRAWVTFSTKNEIRGNYGFADKLDRQVERVRRYGAGGFEYTLIANGGIEGRIMYNGHGHEWDFAPTTLLVQEAGGCVANIGSSTYNYRELNHVAANPKIFDQLMNFVNEVEKDAKTSTD
jgi:fructose-1,6-bisphosphatase/inositol monophosphatase family enzyme